MTRTRKTSKKGSESGSPGATDADASALPPLTVDEGSVSSDAPASSSVEPLAAEDSTPADTEEGASHANETPDADPGETSVELRAPAADDAADLPLPVVLPEDILSGGDAAGERLPLDDDEIGPGLEKAPPVAAGASHLKSVVEALIFASDKPVSLSELARAANARAPELRPLLSDLIEEYRGRGVELVEVSGGFQFRTSAVAAPFVRDYVAAKPVRLSRAQVETLAIVAYRQPVTRPEIDDIRGVDSGSALKVLLDRGLLKILGKKEEVGRPLIYGTTAQFLEFFGLASLRDLPTLREFTELTDESKALFQRRSGEPLGDLGVSSEEIARETEVDREAAEREASEAVAEVDRAPAEPEAALAADGDEADSAEDAAASESSSTETDAGDAPGADDAGAEPVESVIDDADEDTDGDEDEDDADDPDEDDPDEDEDDADDDDDDDDDDGDDDDEDDADDDEDDADDADDDDEDDEDDDD
jgi:segregation and condensation protein B